MIPALGALNKMEESEKLKKHANQFVQGLLTEGAEIPCDDSCVTFNETDDLPPFYNEELFKKGQEFYHKNVFAIFSAKIFGLISVLAIPSILRILVHTKKSGNELSAYHRYVSTIFHMIIWYDADFKPGSRLWKSLAEVKNLHSCASKSGCKAGLSRISQKDMALTQFGFMGYQLIRSEQFGIQEATDENWKGFLHLWRVIGHLLGIKDKFNFCSGSVTESKAICEELLQEVFIPHINKNDAEFLQMTTNLVNGLWVIQPVFNFNVLMCFLRLVLLRNSVMPNDSNSLEYKKLTFWEKCFYQLMVFIFYSLRWKPSRWYHNHTRYRDFWLIKNFPFLAYYKFGIKKSRVRILRKTE